MTNTVTAPEKEDKPVKKNLKKVNKVEKLTPHIWKELNNINPSLYQGFIKKTGLDEAKEYNVSDLDKKYEEYLNEPVFKED